MTIEELKTHTDAQDKIIADKIDLLRAHSDKQDTILWEKFDKLDDFIHNGLSDKIIRGITDYLNEQTARRVSLFFKILLPAITVALASGVVKVLFF